MSESQNQRCTALHCTVESHVTELVTACRAAWLDGKREGHAIGQAEGHLSGFAEGVRSTAVYRIAAADEWRSGYVTALGDLRAKAGEAA